MYKLRLSSHLNFKSNQPFGTIYRTGRFLLTKTTNAIAQVSAASGQTSF